MTTDQDEIVYQWYRVRQLLPHNAQRRLWILARR